MQNKTRDKAFISIRGILKILLVHSFIVIYIAMGGYILLDLFVTRRQDSISLTYYGFAIFAVLANICFSYARAFDNTNEQSYLRGLGERFLFSALGFLIGSILNYININYRTLFENFPLPTVLIGFCEIVSGLFFTASFVYGAIAVHSLLDHLFERTTLDKDNYYNKSKTKSN